MRRLTRQDSMESTVVDDGSNRLLLEVARTAWSDCALLFLLAAGCLVVFAPFFVVASITGWLVVWAPMVLAAAPFWLVTIVVGDRLLEGRGVATRELPGLWRRHAVAAWRIGLVPALSGVATLGMFELTRRAPDALAPSFGLLIALGVSITVAVLINPTMAAAGRYEIGPMHAWSLGARWFIAAPVQLFGLVACGGLLVWLAVVVGPVALLGIGPLGLLTAALAREPASAGVDSIPRSITRGIESTPRSR